MTPTDQLLAEDSDNRQRALEIDSFIVEAPAGAGKTELLTQRYLRLLAIVDEPEEVIAITFTNKAAGEMRARIQESLELARSGVMPDLPHKQITYELARAALARSAAAGWQIEQQAGRLRLTTIDALCASLARQMPFLSRFGSQPAVAEEANLHYEAAARRAVDHLEGEGEFAAAVATALGYLDNDVSRLVRLLAQMLARREQWQGLTALDDPEAAMDEALAALVGEELERIAVVVDDFWQQRVMPYARFATKTLGGGVLAEWREPLVGEADALPLWRALAELMLTLKNEPRKTVNVKNGFPADKAFKAQKDGFVALLGALDAATVAALARVRDLPSPDTAEESGAESSGETSTAVVGALVRLMKLAAAELWLVFRERGEVDFGELASRAIEALGDELDPSELGLRLDYRVRHLLVDEFQDTSPTQIDLLKRLTAGWQPNDGRTLFAVGDPMQSIYRFRKADVGLFLRVAESGIGALRLMPLRLSRNNRSSPEIVEWINSRFPAVFPPTDDPVRGEIKYRTFVATRAGLPEAGVMVHPLVLDSADGKDAAARREAQQILAVIEAEWRADPNRTIAVLVRARDHLKALVAAIRQQASDWRFSAVEIEPLLGRQAIQDLISLTRALHHRADRVHWLATLRAPWCGLLLSDLHVLAGDQHEATVWSLMQDAARVARMSADGQLRLGHLREVFAEALAGQGRQSRRRWVEDVWRKLGGPECLDGESEAADARAFFTRLDALDAAGRFALDSLEDAMRRLYAAPDSQADGRLQFMTIHKSKGLEFDTVILPALQREPSSHDAPLLAWESFSLADGERLIAAPVNQRSNQRSRRAKAEPSVYDFLQCMEKERTRNEDARVLYVAATRAVRKLHLFGAVSRDETGALMAPRASSALGRLWGAVEAEFVAANESVEASEGLVVDAAVPESDFVPFLVRRPATAFAAEALAAWTAPFVSTAPRLADEPALDPLAAGIGTLTHACLEQIAAEPEAWSVQSVAQRQPGFERWLGSRGWSPADARTGAARTAAMLVATLESEDGRWVVRRRVSGAAEMAVSRLGAENTLETRVVDRSFVEDGTRWIIDYKTAWVSAATESSPLANALKAHAERFRSQLESYARLFSGEGIPCRLAVFYVAHGTLASLDYNPPLNGTRSDTLLE